MKTTAFFTRMLSWLTVDNSVVRELSLDRFLGSWYEVARFNHFFERGMSQTKARSTLVALHSKELRAPRRRQHRRHQHGH